MKSERIYTARGTLVAGEVKRLILFDGQFDTAYRILDFSIAPEDITTSENVMMKVMTEEKPHNTQWFWADNREVGWAIFDRATSVSPGEYNRIDKDALIVEDLFLDCTADSGENVNYMITLEKVKISDWLGALSMVRNNSQDV